jgi:hypothetical protein
MSRHIAEALLLMRILYIVAIMGALSSGAAWSQAGTPVTLRGTMKSVADGGMIGVTMELLTEEGEAAHLFLNDTYEVLPVVRRGPQDVKQGMVLAAWHAAGNQSASGIRLFHGEVPASAMGSRPWDRPPGSTMTVGRVAKIAEQEGQMFVTLASPEGERTLRIGPDTVVFGTEQRSTDMSLLSPGSYLVIEALLGTDGTYTTGRMFIAKDGFKPPL